MFPLKIWYELKIGETKILYKKILDWARKWTKKGVVMQGQLYIYKKKSMSNTLSII